jgi:hypothetical protein
LIYFFCSCEGAILLTPAILGPECSRIPGSSLLLYIASAFIDIILAVWGWPLSSVMLGFRRSPPWKFSLGLSSVCGDYMSL